MSTEIILSARRISNFKFVSTAFFVAAFAASIYGQTTPVRVPSAPAKTEDFTWWYVTLFALIIGLAGAVFWWMNGKKAQKEADAKSAQKAAKNADALDMNSVDGDKEMEWLRKNQKLVGKKGAPKPRRKKRPATEQQPATGEAVLEVNGVEVKSENNLANGGKAKAEKSLPVFAFERLEHARPFDALPISNDDSLMDAIEQTQDEFEEDEEIRDLTLRILAAFKTRNSVEALSQTALYDLSSSLRSKAVTTLAEFDHESVFDTILLACADPTREVRAAAARALTKLTFDRADAWTRLAENDDEGRIIQAARAAIESGFVDMSFDRLVHKDRKYAYEAFALMALLIKAGETEKIFNALESHRDMNVRRAVLHIIKVTKDQKALDGLYALLEKNNLPIEFQEEVDRTIEEIGFVTV